MTTATTFDRVGRFVADVAACFDDLPADERAELLEDLEQHLSELAAEDPERFDVELRDPRAYAAELRASARIPDGQRRPPMLVRVVDELRDDMRERVAGLDRRLRARPETAAVLEFLPELRPAWWVARGWLVVALVTTLLGDGDLLTNTVLPGRVVLGLPAGIAGAVVSVRLGRRRADLDRRTRAVVRTVDVLAACTAVVLVLQAWSSAAPAEVGMVMEEPMEEVGPAPVLTLPGGEPVTNLYVFDADGRLLRDVLVYDGLGQPVEVGDLARVGFEGIDTVVSRDAQGNPVHNLYPLEQYDVEAFGGGDAGETARTRRPVPDVVVPDIGVPPPSDLTVPDPTIPDPTSPDDVPSEVAAPTIGAHGGPTTSPDGPSSREAASAP